MQDRKILSLSQLVALKDPGRHWLVPQMIPRVGKTMIWGDGGSFKTTAMLDLGIAVASRGQFLQHYPVHETGPVFIVSTEGDIYSLRRRVLSHLRSRDTLGSPEASMRVRPPLPIDAEVPIYFCKSPYDMSEAGDINELEGFIREKKPKMVLFDPLDSFLDGDENSAFHTRKFRKTIDRLVDEYEFAFIVIHHARKESDGRSASARGSSAWRGWVDAHIYFQQHELDLDGKTYPYFDVYAKKQRDGASNERVFAALPIFDAHRQMTHFIPVDENTVASGALDEAQTRIMDALWLHAPSPLTQTEIMHVSRLSHPRLKKALDLLLKDGWAAQDVPVMRATGDAESGRTRKILAWRPIRKATLVDAAIAILGRQEQRIESDLETYDLTPITGIPNDAGSYDVIKSSTRESEEPG